DPDHDYRRGRLHGLSRPGHLGICLMAGLPDERPSKSQRKRDHLALVELARQLAALSDRTRRHLVGDDIVLEALQQAANMKASGARERQLKYIAQLLE